MLTLFGLAVCGYLVLVAGLYVVQRQLLYFPDRSIPSRTASGVVEMSEVRLHTDDGLDLLAWHRPAPHGRATILYLHGNGGHIGYRGDRVRPFIDAGFGVLLVEYRGYGGNPGEPSEHELMSDARAALVFLDTAGASTVNPSAAPWPWRSRRSRRLSLSVGAGPLAAEGSLRGGGADRRRRRAAADHPWGRRRNCPDTVREGAVRGRGGGHENLAEFGLHWIAP